MEIRLYPDPALSKKSIDVEPNDASAVELLEKMLIKMHQSNGVGLAAPQIGISKKIVVIEFRTEINALYKMINPNIVWKSEKLVESEEGCLSLPLLYETVMRHDSVSVEYLNEKFEKCFIEKATGLVAICLQHEIDHLYGKLYIDRLSKLKRSRAIRKFKKLQEEKRQLECVDNLICEENNEG